MKKRRGKRPVKPNLTEALKDRVIDLKGAQFSSMNIPIVYRRTFDWEGDSVLFRPINKRSFVVQRPDLDGEELDPSGYVNFVLDLNDLPYYTRTRTDAEETGDYHLEELKESLISFSLADRYVNIDIPRPDDRRLDELLRTDLEFLSKELGYDYSMHKLGYRCTFVFPRHNNEQTVKRCAQSINDSLNLMKALLDELEELKPEDAGARLGDLHYSISTAEHNIDRFYTEALNVFWDLPQTEAAGHFLIIQACERVHDEIEFIVNGSKEAAALLSEEKRPGVLWDLFVNLWQTSIRSAVNTLEGVLAALDDPEAVPVCLEILRKHRKFKENRSSDQVAFVSHLTRALEPKDGGGYQPLVGREYVQVLNHLFGMNLSSARIEDISSIIATKVLYLRNSARTLA